MWSTHHLCTYIVDVRSKSIKAMSESTRSRSGGSGSRPAGDVRRKRGKSVGKTDGKQAQPSQDELSLHSQSQHLGKALQVQRSREPPHPLPTMEQMMRQIANRDLQLGVRLKAFEAVIAYVNTPTNQDSVYALVNSIIELLHNVLLNEPRQHRLQNAIQKCAVALSMVYTINGVKDNPVHTWVYEESTVVLSTPNCTLLWLRIVRELLKAESGYYLTCTNLVDTICTQIVVPLLDSAPSVAIATTMLEVLFAMATSSASMTLATYLPDIADVVLGWYLDKTTPRAIRDEVMMFYNASGLLWRVRLDVTVAHIGQILTDMTVVSNSAAIRQARTLMEEHKSDVTALDSIVETVTHLSSFSHVLCILIQAVVEETQSTDSETYNYPSLSLATQTSIYNARHTLTHTFVETAIVQRVSSCYSTAANVLSMIPESEGKAVVWRLQVLPVLIDMHNLVNVMCDLIDPNVGVSKKHSNSLAGSLISTAGLLGRCCCHVNVHRSSTSSCYCSSGEAVANVLSTVSKAVVKLLGNCRSDDTSVYTQLWGEHSSLWQLICERTPAVVMSGLVDVWDKLVAHAHGSFTAVQRVWVLLRDHLLRTTHELLRVTNSTRMGMLNSVDTSRSDIQLHAMMTDRGYGYHSGCGYENGSENVNGNHTHASIRDENDNRQMQTHNHAHECLSTYEQISYLSTAVVFDCYVVTEILICSEHAWLLHDQIHTSLIECLVYTPMSTNVSTSAFATTKTSYQTTPQHVQKSPSPLTTTQEKESNLSLTAPEAYFALVCTVLCTAKKAGFYLPQSYQSRPTNVQAYPHVHTHTHTHAYVNAHTYGNAPNSGEEGGGIAGMVGGQGSCNLGMGAVMKALYSGISDHHSTIDVLRVCFATLIEILRMTEGLQSLSERAFVQSKRLITAQPAWEDLVIAVCDRLLTMDDVIAEEATTCLSIVQRIRLVGAQTQPLLINHIDRRWNEAASHTNSRVRNPVIALSLTMFQLPLKDSQTGDIQVPELGLLLKQILYKSTTRNEDPRLDPLVISVPNKIRVDTYTNVGINRKSDILLETKDDKVTSDSSLTVSALSTGTELHTDMYTHTGGMNSGGSVSVSVDVGESVGDGDGGSGSGASTHTGTDMSIGLNSGSGREDVSEDEILYTSARVPDNSNNTNTQSNEVSTIRLELSGVNDSVSAGACLGADVCENVDDKSKATDLDMGPNMHKPLSNSAQGNDNLHGSSVDNNSIAFHPNPLYLNGTNDSIRTNLNQDTEGDDTEGDDGGKDSLDNNRVDLQHRDSSDSDRWALVSNSPLPAMGSFGPDDFEDVMSLLLSNDLLDETHPIKGRTAHQWLLYLMVTRLTPEQVNELIPPQIAQDDSAYTKNIDERMDHSLLSSFFLHQSEAVVWFWALSQCASYAVRNRLKTSFGGPSQTLISLETGFVALATVKVGPDTSSTSTAGPGHGNNIGRIQRLALCTVFIDLLEKYILTAVFGSGGLGSPEKSVCVFFGANSKVCTEWFTRSRETFMRMASLCGFPSAVIRHGQSYLGDLDKKHNGTTLIVDEKVAAVLVLMASALINTHAGIDLQGMYRYWLNRTTTTTGTAMSTNTPTQSTPTTPTTKSGDNTELLTGIECEESAAGDFDWIHACAQYVAGRIECALDIYEKVLNVLSCPAKEENCPLPPPAEQTNAGRLYALTDGGRECIVVFIREQIKRCELICDLSVSDTNTQLPQYAPSYTYPYEQSMEIMSSLQLQNNLLPCVSKLFLPLAAWSDNKSNAECETQWREFMTNPHTVEPKLARQCSNDKNGQTNSHAVDKVPTIRTTPAPSYTITSIESPFVMDVASTVGMSAFLWGEKNGLESIQRTCTLVATANWDGIAPLQHSRTISNMQSDFITLMMTSMSCSGSFLSMKTLMWSMRFLDAFVIKTRSSKLSETGELSEYGGPNNLVTASAFARSHGNVRMAEGLLSRFDQSLAGTVSQRLVHKYSQSQLVTPLSGRQGNVPGAEQLDAEFLSMQATPLPLKTVQGCWVGLEKAHVSYDVGHVSDAMEIIQNIARLYPIDITVSKSNFSTGHHLPQKLRVRVRGGDLSVKEDDRLRAAVLLSLAEWLEGSDAAASHIMLGHLDTCADIRLHTPYVPVRTQADARTVISTPTSIPIPSHTSISTPTSANVNVASVNRHSHIYTYEYTTETVRRMLSYASHISPMDPDMRYAYANHCFDIGSSAVKAVHTQGNMLTLNSQELESLRRVLSTYLLSTACDTNADISECLSTSEGKEDNGCTFLTDVMSVLCAVEWTMADAHTQTTRPQPSDESERDGTRWRTSRQSLVTQLQSVFDGHTAHIRTHEHARVEAVKKNESVCLDEMDENSSYPVKTNLEENVREEPKNENDIHMTVNGLIRVREICISRTLGGLERAASEYFAYLHITAGGINSHANSSLYSSANNDRSRHALNNMHTSIPAPNTHADPINDNVHMHITHTHKNTHIRSLVAPLRLLNLLVHFGPELAGVMTDGLETTPWVAWSSVVPQLLAQFSHPEQYVCDRIVALISRIGLVRPQSVVFAALAGANSSRALTTCVREQFEVVVQALKAVHGPLVAGVALLMDELANLSQLPEERWRNVLGRLSRDAAQRISRLKAPLVRIANSDNIHSDQKMIIAANQCKAVLDPLVHEIERLREETFGSITSARGSHRKGTLHQRQFMQLYADRIELALQALSSPCGKAVLAASLLSSKSTNHSRMKEAEKKLPPDDTDLRTLLWGPFNVIFESLQSQIRTDDRIKKKFRLADLAPGLVHANLSAVFLPLDRRVTAGQICEPTIYRFVDEVEILPTNTRPKKLKLWGSDGASYTYLYKGTEDMHLDQRIMQFLKVVNTLLGDKTLSSTEAIAGRVNMGCHAKGTEVMLSSLSSNQLHANTYAVTPLGERCGLVQWVDGATPLFNLYRRWQQRGIACGTLSTAAGLRPSEQFWATVGPRLEKSGTSRNKARDRWPVELLRKSHAELAATVPDSLIANEMFSHASTPFEWRKSQQRYVYSTAVMAVVGYVLGLGDRHLDNILLHPNTGEILHIDYSVCFEKGHRLRVPETVPCRLTGNIVRAMGPTATEGAFRTVCETVLTRLRMGHEFLLLLLEAFIYDPVVDWAVRSADYSRLEIEVMSALRALGVRVAEIGTQLHTTAVNLHTRVIPALVGVLQTAYGKQHEINHHARMVVKATEKENALLGLIQEHGDIHARIKQARASAARMGERENALKRTLNQRLTDAVNEVNRVRDVTVTLPGAGVYGGSRKHSVQLTKSESGLGGRKYTRVPTFMVPWLKNHKPFREKYTDAVSLYEKEVMKCESSYRKLSDALNLLRSFSGVDPPTGSEMIVRVLQPIMAKNTTIEQCQYAEDELHTVLESWPPTQTVLQRVVTVDTEVGRISNALQANCEALESERKIAEVQFASSTSGSPSDCKQELLTYANLKTHSTMKDMSSTCAAALTAIGVALSAPSSLHTDNTQHSRHTQPSYKRPFSPHTNADVSRGCIPDTTTRCCVVRTLTETLQELLQHGNVDNEGETLITRNDDEGVDTTEMSADSTIGNIDEDANTDSRTVKEEDNMSWVGETCQTMANVSQLICDTAHASLALELYFDKSFVPQLVHLFVWGETIETVQSTALTGIDAGEIPEDDDTSIDTSDVMKSGLSRTRKDVANAPLPTFKTDSFEQDMAAMATLYTEADRCVRELGGDTGEKGAFDVASMVSSLRRRYRISIMRPWAAPLRDVDAFFKRLEQQYDSLTMECDVSSVSGSDIGRSAEDVEDLPSSFSEMNVTPSTKLNVHSHSSNGVGMGEGDSKGYSSRDMSWLLRVVAVCGTAVRIYDFGTIVHRLSSLSGDEGSTLEDVDNFMSNALKGLLITLRSGGLQKFKDHFYSQRMEGLIESITVAATRVVTTVVSRASKHGDQDLWDNQTEPHEQMTLVSTSALTHGTYKTTERVEATRLVDELVYSCYSRKQLNMLSEHFDSASHLLKASVTLQRRFQWRHESVLAHYFNNKINTQIQTSMQAHGHTHTNVRTYTHVWVEPRRSEVIHTLQREGKVLMQAVETRKSAEDALKKIENQIKQLLAQIEQSATSKNSKSTQTSTSTSMEATYSTKKKRDVRRKASRDIQVSGSINSSPRVPTLAVQFITWVKAREVGEYADEVRYTNYTRTTTGVCAVYGRQMNDLLPPCVAGQRASLKSVWQCVVSYRRALELFLNAKTELEAAESACALLVACGVKANSRDPQSLRKGIDGLKAERVGHVRKILEVDANLKSTAHEVNQWLSELLTAYQSSKSVFEMLRSTIAVVVTSAKMIGRDQNAQIIAAYAESVYKDYDRLGEDILTIQKWARVGPSAEVVQCRELVENSDPTLLASAPELSPVGEGFLRTGRWDSVTSDGLPTLSISLDGELDDTQRTHDTLVKCALGIQRRSEAVYAKILALAQAPAFSDRAMANSEVTDTEVLGACSTMLAGLDETIELDEVEAKQSLPHSTNSALGHAAAAVVSSCYSTREEERIALDLNDKTLESPANHDEPAIWIHNRHAEKAVIRVHEKLRGFGPQNREAGQQNMLSVRQQVADMIKEAKSPKNLSLMFEGWMAWV
eukprot:CFRG3260T1